MDIQPDRDQREKDCRGRVYSFHVCFGGEKALEDAGTDPQDLDLIIVATCSPDYFSQIQPAVSRRLWEQ